MDANPILRPPTVANTTAAAAAAAATALVTNLINLHCTALPSDVLTRFDLADPLDSTRLARDSYQLACRTAVLYIVQ